MTKANLLRKANQLIQLRRYAEAERELRQILSTDPNDGYAMSLLALCRGEQGQTDEAISMIQTAIGLYPFMHFYHYLYALFLYRQENFPESEKKLLDAIAIEPDNAEYFGLLGSIRLNQKQWDAALEDANKGLALDPDNLTCLNTRSTALLKLDKKEDAYLTIEKALRNDPENESTHANLGWGLLEKGEHKKELLQFRKDGYRRVKIDEQIFEIEDAIKNHIDKNKKT